MVYYWYTRYFTSSSSTLQDEFPGAQQKYKKLMTSAVVPLLQQLAAAAAAAAALSRLLYVFCEPNHEKYRHLCTKTSQQPSLLRCIHAWHPLPPKAPSTGLLFRIF
mmetsp:Transcript_10623/g.14855  ORF Transcript_10623/g.14855 Transcript_10623/m.14855 type:complete len:106 (+) Transcript_10623:244-561(+)